MLLPALRDVKDAQRRGRPSTAGRSCSHGHRMGLPNRHARAPSDDFGVALDVAKGTVSSRETWGACTAPV